MADNYELDKGDQFIIAGDVSGSMATPDCPGGMTRLAYMVETMLVFAGEAFKWDDDGVSFYMFNNSVKAFPDLKDIAELKDKLGGVRAMGGTATHKAIEAAWIEHKQKGSKQTFLMLFTDGDPNDEDKPKVESVITSIANEISDAKEFRISILTVGNRSPELEAWLSHLDNSLQDAKHDIVAVNRLENVDFENAVQNAIEG